jgi:Predicted hydrolases or acyltransferases (alpha/beta hydrolase superfamily)
MQRCVGLLTTGIEEAMCGSIDGRMMLRDAIGGETSAVAHVDHVEYWRRKNGMIDTRLALKLRRQGDPNPNDREALIEHSLTMWKWISGHTFDEAEAREFTAAGIDRAVRVEGTERQTAAIFASRDRTTALRGVRTPTLVIHGLVDPLVRSSGGEATARAIPDARLLMFPEMGHDLPEGRWNEISEAIRQNADRAPLPV